MQSYNYNISSFYYDKLSNTFFAEEKNLLSTTIDNTSYVFPNKRKKFFIKDIKTERIISYMQGKKMITDYIDEVFWFRRFKFKTEDLEFYTFVSEDGIICKIKKENYG